MKYIVPFSGGKDSEGTLVYAVETYGAENVTAVFCDVKWDHKITYNHIDYVVKKAGVKLINLYSKLYDGFVDLALKERFPSTTKRICTVKLKVEPMIDYILDDCNCHVLILQGIRADESPARSLMEKQCTFFKYYFHTVENNTMIVNSLTKKPKLNKLQIKKLAKANSRLLLGKEDNKFHTYRKKDVFAFCEKYVADIERPFFNATADEIIQFSLNRGYLIHPFYFLGISRIGCFPCIMATLVEMTIILVQFSETLDKIRHAESYGTGTFFPTSYIPKRYHTGYVIETRVSFCYIDDVIRYLKDRMATGDLFENDVELNSCKSVYMVCE